MSDILSALSLFLAVLGLLYSAWYTELNAAVNELIPKFKQDRKPIENKISSVYKNKALPLSLSGIIISLIILPDFLNIITEVIDVFIKNGFSSFKYYDSVKTLFCAIFILLVVFSIHLIQITFRLHKMILKCQKD